MKLNNRQLAVLEFMKECHGDQQRKYDHAPYWTHPYAVAELASRFVKADGIIEIALCHDILEDTACDESRLAAEFAKIGYDPASVRFIMEGIVGLTDIFTKENYPEMNRKERKKQEAIRLGHTSAIVQSVKYADLADNTKSIVSGDPGFARVYLREAADLLDQMRKGNVHLLIECCHQFALAMKQLN